MKLPSIKKVSRLFSSKILYTVVVLVFAGVLGYLGVFLYKNVYQVITQADEIILLRQEVAPDTVNTEQVEVILKKLELKKMETAIDSSAVPNPFRPLPPAPPPVAEPVEAT